MSAPTSPSSAIIPPTMRVWSYTRRGPPRSVLSLSTVLTASLIPLAPTSVLIKISHAALNPAGYTLMQLVPAFLRAAPVTPEFDYSGVIISTGSAVRPSLRVGAHVFGVASIDSPQIKAGAGTLAEYVVFDEEFVAVKPEKVSWEEAAGLGVVGITALQFLDRSGLKEGESVLVNGGSGGSGQMIVQEAKRVVGPTGRVVATCSGRNAEMVKALGVDEVIDYMAHSSLHDFLVKSYSTRPFDAIIDTVGSQDLYTHSPAYLHEGKPFLNLGSGFTAEISLRDVLYMAWSMTSNYLWPRLLWGTPREYIFFGAKPDGVTLERLRQYVDEGKLKGVTDSVWDMEDALKAYDRLKSRRAKGKVVVKVQSIEKS